MFWQKIFSPKRTFGKTEECFPRKGRGDEPSSPHGKGYLKWWWSVCFLGSFALHMARMMFGEKGKRSFFFLVDCDCVYCCEHTGWYSCCSSTDIPPNNLSQSFFEQKIFFFFSEKMELLCNGTLHHKTTQTKMSEQREQQTTVLLCIHSFPINFLSSWTKSVFPSHSWFANVILITCHFSLLYLLSF